MKTKEWIEIKNLSLPELEARLVNMQNDIFKLKFRHSITPIKNPLSIRVLRRNIARFKTLIALKKREENSITGKKNA